jgi:hypothetical protein
MKTEKKIDQLRAAFIAGEELTPKLAYARFGMAMNTFNRQLHQLKHRERYVFKSRWIEGDGVRYKAHLMPHTIEQPSEYWAVRGAINA